MITTHCDRATSPPTRNGRCFASRGAVLYYKQPSPVAFHPQTREQSTSSSAVLCCAVEPAAGARDDAWPGGAHAAPLQRHRRDPSPGNADAAASTSRHGQRREIAPPPPRIPLPRRVDAAAWFVEPFVAAAGSRLPASAVAATGLLLAACFHLTVHLVHSFAAPCPPLPAAAAVARAAATVAVTVGVLVAAFLLGYFFSQLDGFTVEAYYCKAHVDLTLILWRQPLRCQIWHSSKNLQSFS
ncbi:hypothetical protein ZWY2020_038913 [Hordeum vulgare]|nr:hypothetical protein ZWY2020_038913 [Hordeum vulgare]